MGLRFVRITKAGHPLRGMIGSISTAMTEDGFERVTLLNSSFSAYFKPGDIELLEGAFFLPEQLNVRLEHLGKDRYHLFVNGRWMYAFFVPDVLMRAYHEYQRQGHACTVVAAGEIVFYSRRVID